MKEKKQDIIKEVLDEIEASLKDPNGVVSHQRRLAFALSLGASSLLEGYLEKKKILKPGAKINHQWLKKKKENVKKLISTQTVSILEHKEIDKILDLAYDIEKDRNELSYGKPASEDTLKEKIDIFLKLKKEINENE